MLAEALPGPAECWDLGPSEDVDAPQMQGQVLGSAMLRVHLGMVTGTTGGERNGLEIQVGSPSAGLGAVPMSSFWS